MFYAVIAAGAAFIVIGIASAIYANVSVRVAADGTVKPRGVDVLTPDMDPGNTAQLSFQGTNYTVTVKGPDGSRVLTHNDTGSYSYTLTADKSGQYRIETKNLSNSSAVSITGYADTKSSPLGFTGALMLAITGVVLLGLAVRVRGSR